MSENIGQIIIVHRLYIQIIQQLQGGIRPGCDSDINIESRGKMRFLWDELDDVSVRHGFTHRPQIQDEYGSALHAAFTSAKIASNFNAILRKKAELNQMPDTGRKKQQINIKDNFWHATPRSKTTIEAWFKDLAGSKPLTSLAKKVPIFPKREEMLLTLCEYSVPMSRATWFIKMTSFYQESKMAESKIKRRPQPDLSQEWTQTITRFLREHLNKIAEIFVGSSTGSGSSSTSSSLLGSMNIPASGTISGNSSQATSLNLHLIMGLLVEICQGLNIFDIGIIALNLHSLCIRYLNTISDLEGLLDRQEFLDWIVDAVVRLRQPEQDCLLRVVLPLVLQYLDEITQSEFHSRKLSYYSAQKIKQLCQESNTSEPAATHPTSPATNQSNSLNASSSQSNTSAPAGATSLQDLLSCHQHRPILLALSCFIQAVTLDCPTAMVWNFGCEGKTPPWLIGSPLDLLPSPPSDLPMPPRYNKNQVRAQLRVMEEHIRQRSKAAENRWSLDKSCVNISGTTITRVLGALEALDTHCFSKVDQNNCIDTLYAKIFSASKEVTSEGNNSSSASGTTITSLPNTSLSGTSHSSSSNNSSTTGNSCNGSSKGSKGPNGNTCEDAVIRTLCEWAVSAQRSGEHRALVVARLLEKRQNEKSPLENDNSEEKESSESTSTSNSNPYVFQDLLLKFLDTQAPVYDENALSVRSQEFGNLILLFSELIRQDVFSHDAYMCTLISRGDLACAQPHLKNTDCLSSDRKEDCTDNIDDDIDKILQNIAKEADAPDSPKDDVNTSLEDQSAGSRGERGAGGKHRPPRHLIYAQHFPLPSDDNYNHEINQVLDMLSGVGSGISNYLPVLDHICFLMDLMEVGLNIQGLLDLCTQIIKEVVDIELQLVERQCLVGIYCPQLTLHVVGILRKYHCCLLVSQEQTIAVFEGLCRLVKHVTNPSDCTSPERVVLAHLHDLYTSCSFLKSKHHESFSNAYPKIKQTLYIYLPPAKVALRWVPQFMEEYIKNPKLKIEPNVVKQLNEPANRFSFVWSAVIEACSPTTSNEKLNDLAILCAELTACCNSLSSEWLRVLNILCCSSESNPGYNEVLAKIDLSDPRSSPTIHSSLSVFTAILIARHCFTLANFLNHVVFQSLKAAWNSGIGNPDAEPGARLTCHLLLRIFKSVESPQPSQYGSVSPQNVPTSISQRNIRMNCDRYLLAAAAHLSLTMAPVLAVLKAMLIVSDAMSGQSKSQASISDILGTSDVGNGSNDSDMLGKGADKACLADFARYALRQICSQEWVRERCLKGPKELCSKDNLLDRMLSSKQALRLLHLICHPDSPSIHSDASLDHHTILSNILEDLDEWTLRISWLDLKLMYEQHRGAPSTQQELNVWLDNVAQAVINVFQQNTESESNHKNRNVRSRSINLVAPLISKLPKAVQGRVLKAAGEFLNSVNFGGFSTKPNTQQQSGRLPGTGVSSVLQQQQQQQQLNQAANARLQWPVSSHRPFLQLVLMCLEGQEEQLQGLLDSLKDQLNQAVNLYKEDKTRAIEDSQCRQQILEALKLRFALVGSLFDTIISSGSSSLICEWAQLLVNLILHGVIDLTNNSDLFTTSLDMLTALIHSTLVVEVNSESREENRKNYSMVVKKVKKVRVLDHKNVSLRLVRQLTPFPKVQTEIIALEPWGTITDTKGNRVQDFEKDKKHGLQVADKQKLSPWDLLDGHRNPAPLSWIWFAATRLERKPLKYEECHRLQRFHTHSMVKPFNYFLEPPPLPPEDLEPVPEKQISCNDLPMKEEVKAPDTPSSDQSPRGTSKRGNKTQRPRKQRSRQPSVPPMANNPMQPMPYQNPNFTNAPQNQWGGNFAQQHQQPQPQQQQPAYCAQQLPPASGPRFGTPTTQVRVAIRQFMVHRQPSMLGQQNQANFQSLGPMNPMSRPAPMIRTQLRGGIQNPHQNAMYSGTSNMQGQLSQGMPSQANQMYSTVGGGSMGGQGGPNGPAQGGMGQYNYQQASLASGQMLSQGPGPTGPGMMSQGYQQTYQNSSAMLNLRQQQQQQQQQPYMGPAMGQGQMVQRPQYMQGPAGNAGMGIMNNNQGYSRPSMQTMGQGAPSNIMRQRMLLGGNTGATGQPGGPGQNNSVMTHLQRPMTGVNPQQTQQQQPQQQPQNQQQSQQTQQAQQQQQMMHTSTQGMGFPQPPPY
ncbi:Mediator of RNA polymerase II transcription subunit 12 [Armadillidium vulgare]|nr:Mediator of RNA polymerase II transcription subunit 12 [Armadillidium vulgare]